MYKQTFLKSIEKINLFNCCEWTYFLVVSKQEVVDNLFLHFADDERFDNKVEERFISLEDEEVKFMTLELCVLPCLLQIFKCVPFK